MRYRIFAVVVSVSLAVVGATERSPAADSLATQWAVPNFAPNPTTAWVLDSLIDDPLYAPVQLCRESKPPPIEINKTIVFLRDFA